MKIYVFNIGQGYDSIFELVIANTQREAVTMLENIIKEEWESYKITNNLYWNGKDDEWNKSIKKAINLVSKGYIGELPIEKGCLTKKYNVSISHIE